MWKRVTSFSSMLTAKLNLLTFLLNHSLQNPSFTSVGNLGFLISRIGCNLIKLHAPYFISYIPLMFDVLIDSLVKTLINLHKGNIHPIYLPFLIIYMFLFRSSSCSTFIILLICMFDLLLLSLFQDLPSKKVVNLKI